MNDFTIDPNPDPANYILNQRRAAQGAAIGALDANPDDAARALQLSEATGAAPALVNSNLEDFEAQHKAALTSHLLNNNPYLRDYVNSHPLAAAISNDDMGNLDAISQHLTEKHLPDSGSFFQGAIKRLARSNPLTAPSMITTESLSDTWDSVKQGLGQIVGAPGALVGIGTDKKPQEDMEKYLLSQGVPQDIAKREAKLVQSRLDRGEGLQGPIFGAMQILSSPAIGPFRHYIAKPLEEKTDFPAEATEGLTFAALGFLGLRGMKAKPLPKVQQTVRAAEPFIKAGEDPPIGVDPIIDEIFAKQAEADGESLDAALKLAGQSTTRERNPEMFARYIAQHTDSRIGISAEAIRGLYGESEPKADDGKLGWISDLGDKLRIAEAGGGDVEVPLSDWLAHVEPDVARELHDNIRVRRGGITLEEAKAFGERDVESDIQKDLVRKKATTEDIDAEFDTVAPGPLYDALEPLRGFSFNPERVQQSIEWAQQNNRPDLVARGIELFEKDAKTAEAQRPGVAEDSPRFKKIQDNLAKLASERRAAAQDIKQKYGEELTQRAQELDKNEAPVLASEELPERVKATRPEEIEGSLRRSAALEPRAEGLAPTDATGLRAIEQQHGLSGGRWANLGRSGAMYVKPAELYTKYEKQIHDAVSEILERIAPANVESAGGHAVALRGHEVKGFYQEYKNNNPVIIWSLAHDSVGNARHEAIHALRRGGFFTEEEWTTLKGAAVEGDWIKKHDIVARYPGEDLSLHLEEAIADEYADWAKSDRNAGPVHPIFERMKQLALQIRNALRDIIGKAPTADELFDMVESGVIKDREGKPLDPRAFKGPVAQQLDLPGMTRLEDRELFGRRVFQDLPKKYYDKWIDLINKRDAEDTDYAAKKAEKDIARRQTAEWKDAAKAIRTEVRANTIDRPDIAGDEFLRSGVLHGEKLRGRPRLDVDRLTDEQRASLPSDYYAKGGINPDDAAGLFGYKTGDEFIQRVAALVQDRGELGPNEYINKITEAEVERRMQNEHGDLHANVLEEAKDHVVSQTQMDILHQEVLGLGMRAGVLDPDAGLTISLADMKAWVKGEFDRQPISEHSVSKYLRDAGRAGNKAINELVKDNPKEAFKFKQQQQIAVMMAREAAALEKARKGFDRLTKQFSAREVGSALQEYTNWIHDIMVRVGKPVRRSIQDIQESTARDGYNSLSDFVQDKSAQLRDLYVPDFLLDPRFRKEYESLTAGEFGEVNKALRAMAHNARDELKVVKEGEKADLKDVLGQMKDKTATLGDKQYPIDRKPSSVVEQAKSWWWSAITVESMLNRLDRDSFSGLFNQYIVREFTSASNYRDRLIREYQSKIAKIGKIPDMDKLVQNDLFKDPISGEPFIMRRRNLLGILQNVGNKNNLRKLAEGYGLDPDHIMQWLHQNTSKADWDRAQKIGDLFEEIFERANQMSHNVSGVGIERLPLEGVDTPHGQYRGWYNPIKYDSLRPGESRRLLGTDIESEGYYRATTPQGYTQRRTGYIAPVQLDLDIVPVRMKQMLHDIAVRPAVLQLSKFFYNPEFKKMMINHYGQHQAEAFIPFLRDFANASNFKSLSEHMGSQALEYLRQNTIANLIGFNPGTVAKHGITAAINSLHEVGLIPWAREFANIVKELPSGQESWRLAFDKSEELQRRMRNYTEIIQGHGSEINIRGARSSFASLREFMIAAGATPVSISDLLSAVPTWLAAYKDQVAQGATEGTSVSFADRAVRRAHGSSVITNRPEIARSNALGSWFTSLYGFFSHMQQKQYELAWKAKDLYKDTFGKGSGDAESTARHALPLLKGIMAYVIIPAMVEEMVTPYTNSDKESWGLKAAKTLALGISSSFIGVRDFVHAAINLRDPQAGLAATSMKAGADLIRDISKGQNAFSKQKAGNLIRHTISLTGVATGLTNETEAKAAKFLFNYNQGLEHPRWMQDWWTGLRHGTMQKVR